MDFSKINLNGQEFNVKDEKARQDLLNLYASNIAELKQITTLNAGDVVKTLGYYEVNDGGSALYQIREKQESDTEDGGLIHFLSNDLVAEMIIDDVVNVKQFGAYGNGNNDDTTAIQNAFNVSHNIYIPDGAYMINASNDGWGYTNEGGVFPQSNTKITMSENAILKAINNTNGFYSVLNLNQVENVTVDGGKIQGEKSTHVGTEGAFGYSILIAECKNVIINNVELSDCWGDGIIVTSRDDLTGNTNNIKITNCVIHDCRRQGISVVVGEDVIIDNCEIYNIGGKSPESGIDIESNGTQYVKNIKITNCYIHNTEESIILANDFVKDVLISNCTLDKINIAGGEKYIINNCELKGRIRVAGDKTVISNSHISQVIIQGGNAHFNNCIFDYETTAEYDGLIFYGNDNYETKVSDLVVFNNCKFNANLNYFLFIPSPQYDINNVKLRFINCDINFIKFGNTIMTDTVIDNCVLNCNKDTSYDVFKIVLTAANFIKFVLRNSKLITLDKPTYLINSNGSAKSLIIIESCEMFNGYTNCIYINNAEALGDLVMNNNLINSNSIANVVGNTNIVKHENNNIKYE